MWLHAGRSSGTIACGTTDSFKVGNKIDETSEAERYLNAMEQGKAAVVLNIQVGSRTRVETIFDMCMSMAFMLVIEPVQLSVFGTTLGKWIMGIRIIGNDGKKLDYASALERTGKVLCFGEGMRIPGIVLWRNYKSYSAYKNDETLEWELNSKVIVKDEAY